MISWICGHMIMYEYRDQESCRKGGIHNITGLPVSLNTEICTDTETQQIIKEELINAYSSQ